MDHTEVDLNAVSQMLGETLIPFEQGVEEENVNQALIEQEMDDPENNATDPDVVAYMEAPAPEFEDVVAWASITVANLWTTYGLPSQPTDDGSIYQGQVFCLKGEVAHAIKTFSSASTVFRLQIHQNTVEIEVQYYDTDPREVRHLVMS